MTKQLLIGMPSTGKTTYLAAFWHVVKSGELEDSLQIDSLDVDTEYLNEIQQRWIACEEVGRTSGGSSKRARFILSHSEAEEVAEVHIPDRSGETFRTQWEERRWQSDFADTARDAEGILLFVHPNEIVEPTTILEVGPESTIQKIEASQTDNSADSRTASEDAENLTVDKSDNFVPWNPSDASTQSKLVDLLQFLEAGSVSEKPLKLAIIVSAWDVVEKQHVHKAIAEEPTPKEWIGERLPLLLQYLNSNPEIFTTRIYGISAQGGDFADDKENLLREKNPTDRITVKTGNEKSKDITEPVKWIMDVSK